MPSASNFSGKVLSVSPAHGGSFGVAIGPGPDITYFHVSDPPRIGEDVAVEGTVVRERTVTLRARRATVRTLAAARWRVLTTSARPAPVVAPKWVELVSTAVRRPLFRYQAEGAAWIAARLAEGRGALLADEPGLGKSTQLLAAIAATGMFPAIIVCPTSLKLNWAKECSFLRRVPSVSIVEKRRGPIERAEVTIVNYPLLRYREEELCDLRARVIGFDEAHELKEPRPKLMHRAQVATRIAHWVGRAVMLTGTPLLNRPGELWRLFHLADPAGWPDFASYAERYCQAMSSEDEAIEGSKRRIVTSVARAERVGELQARASEVMLRRLKPEVLKDLPPKSRRSLLVELDPWDMQRYRQAEHNVVAWFRAQGKDQRVQRATRAMALVKLTELRRLAALGKLRMLHGVLEASFGFGGSVPPEPLVIFGYHRLVLFGSQELMGAAGICQALGARVATIAGDDPPDRREAAVEAFASGDADVFIAPIKSAGVGLNLQRASSSLFLERVWVPAEMSQAEDRLHRIGQEQPVVATYLDAAGTIDERIAEVLDEKAHLASQVIDNDDPYGPAFATASDVIMRLAPK